MFLADNERIIKEWRYGVGNSKDNSLECSLVVTNKRVISSEYGNFTRTKREMRTENVSAIETSYQKSSVLGAVGMLLLGIVLVIVSIFLLKIPELEDLSFLFWILIVPGVVLVIVAIMMFIQARECNMEIKIYSESRENSGVLSFQNALIAKRGSQPLKFHVRGNIAADIVETLGAVLLTNR